MMRCAFAPPHAIGTVLAFLVWVRAIGIRDLDAETMKPKTIAVPTATTRPNRLLLALAAAWMILSLAIGGAVTADSPEDAAAPAQTITSATEQ